MRWLRRVLVTLATLAVLVVVGLALIPAKTIADFAARQFEAATGRALALSGEVAPTIWPVLGVRTGPLEIANADWAADTPMVSAESLVIGLKLAPLLRGEIAVDEFRIERPRIRLERRADGAVNWDFAAATQVSGDSDGDGDSDGGADGGGGAGEAPTPAARAIAVDRAEIVKGEILYLDATGRRLDLAGLDLTARLPAAAGPAEIAAAARLNGVPLKIEARVASVQDFLGGALSGLELDIASGGNTARFDGRAGLAPVSGEGEIVADLPELSQLFRAAGLEAPVLPAGLGRDRVAAEGALTWTTEGTGHLRGASLTLDGNRLAGEADLTFGPERPRLVARLSAGTLDLSGLAGGDDASSGGSSSGGSSAGSSGSGGGGGSGAAAGWPDTPIDVAALAALDAELALNAAALDFGDAAFGPAGVVARLDAARLVLVIREFGAYGGDIAGEFVVNGRGGLSVGGDLSMAGVQLQPFLVATADYDRLTGSAEGRIAFLGTGPSVDAIMKSLSGEGRFAIGKGELLGLDLVGMLRNFDLSYRGPGAKTIFDGISASFTIAGGVLSNDDLAFVAPLAEATGAGTVDLGRQRLDYTVVPVAFASRGDGAPAGGLRVPVKITGPWADPSFRPDLEAAAEAELGVTREEAEEAVEEAVEGAVRRKIEEEVGPVEEGESVEDALRRKLEEEAGGALRRLLGGD
jgi:AsmA protein